MSAIAEKIHEEVQRLPENLANQVYDFICFIEARHGIRSLEEDSPHPEWDSFFKHHTRTVTDATPLPRDDIYAERLR
jgi:hypothetical protein